MVNQKKSHLFLVVLGGRAKKANVELHDVRWVIGSKSKIHMILLEGIGLG